MGQKYYGILSGTLSSGGKWSTPQWDRTEDRLIASGSTLTATSSSMLAALNLVKGDAAFATLQTATKAAVTGFTG